MNRGAGRRRGDTWIVVALFATLILVGIAMGALWRYKSSPGAQAEAPPRWPAESHIERAPGLATLVMFAHPMCPCTRASLSELRGALSGLEGRVSVHVRFALPEGVGSDWTTGDAWTDAASIPGVQAEPDPGEREAALFGAKTSGHVVLYDGDGDLVFRGGITGARGHVGDNEGRSRLVALLHEPSAARAGSPVFGCPLEDP